MLRWKYRLLVELLIWVTYTVVAICFTYPLILHLSDCIPGSGADSIQYYWFAWWDGLALFSPGMNVFHCPLVFFPSGAHLNAEPLPFGLIFGLISRLFPSILTFNILYLFLYIFSAWGCYRLALYLFKRREAAFIAGLVFGFSPFMMVHGIGHINMLNGGLVALTILYFFKVLDGDNWHLGKILIAGFLYGLVGVSSSYYFIFISLWLIGLCLFLIIKRRIGPAIGRIAAIAIVAAIVMLPQLIAMFKGIQSGYYVGVSSLGSAYMSSIDLFGVLLPPSMHPIWGDWIAKTFQFMGAGSVEKAAYLGVVVILLAVLGWWRYRYQIWISWVSIWTLGAWILSLGPILQAFGRNIYIPLPGMIVVLIPVLRNLRLSSRWSMLVALGVALLVAAAVKWLIEHRIAGKRIKWIWIPFSLVVVFEFLPFPYPIIMAEMPEQVYQLQENPNQPVVLNLPLGRSDGFDRVGEFDIRALLLQTEHHKPIIGGYLTRMGVNDGDALKTGFLSDLICIQTHNTKYSPGKLRAERMKNKIREWAEKDYTIIRILEMIAGKEKIRKIINPPQELAITEHEFLPPDSVETQAHRLGIGYVIAIDPSRPQVSAGLEYLNKNLNLTPIGREDNYEFYRVNYPSY